MPPRAALLACLCLLASPGAAAPPSLPGGLNTVDARIEWLRTTTRSGFVLANFRALALKPLWTVSLRCHLLDAGGNPIIGGSQVVVDPPTGEWAYDHVSFDRRYWDQAASLVCRSNQVSAHW